MKKRLSIICLLLCIFLGGCSFQVGDDLLAVPKPPEDYVSLRKELDKILEQGATFAVPESGPNRHTVQLLDIDADGQEEAISFFKMSSGESRFMIYLHKKIGDEYITMGSITGNGSAIESVYYPTIYENGTRGIVICWGMGDSTDKGMTICKFDGGRLYQLLDEQYTYMKVLDLDDDGVDEILSIQKDAMQNQHGAELYSFSDGNLLRSSKIMLSNEISSVLNIEEGYIEGPKKAVFIESTHNAQGLLTDILLKSADGEIRNITVDPITGSGVSTVRPVNVLCQDVNSDGITEVPTAIILPGYSGQKAVDTQWYYLWRSYSQDGTAKDVMYTYHQFGEEWFFRIAIGVG